MANSSQEYFGASHWAVTFTTTGAVTQVIKFVKPPSDFIPSGAALVSGGIADAGGTTTTMVDAARTEKEDFWNGKLIRFTSGTNSGQIRLITDFVAGTDTATFAPAVGAAVGAADTYDILNGTITNRLVITGYAISASNTNAAASLIVLRSHVTTAAIALRWTVPPTTGALADSCSNLWLPLVADEHLEINVATLTGVLQLTVFGRTLPTTMAVSEKYDMSA